MYLKSAAACAAALTLFAGTTACTGDDPESRAAAAAEEFLKHWTTGEFAKAGAQTDTPRSARTLLDDTMTALQVEETSYTLSGEAVCEPQPCRQRATLTHGLAGIGTWTYDTTVTLTETADDEFEVRWTPQILHPKLRPGTRLSRVRTLAPRASILDREGRPLTSNRQVARIGVVAGKVRSSTYDDLVRILDIDGDSLRANVAAAEPDWFVPVINLRDTDYQPVRDELLEVPGISIDMDTWSLPPSSTWGRALLGSVGPATKETLKDAGPNASAADILGVSGLQRAFQPQLAGQPGGSVLLVDDKTGKTKRTLFRSKPQRGKPLHTTLDFGVQDAAESAVQQQRQVTALVALEVGSGAVLASAVGPDIQSYNKAFEGQYPPGSTFKTVSASALLAAGKVQLDEPAQCPTTETVEGKSFKNYDDFQPLSAGATFDDAFAASCNTAMVSRASRLGDSSLHDMATQLGVGADWKLGVPAFSGDVPVNESLVDKAASMIGQGRVLMSPLAMASVAEAVASGTPHPPTLVDGRGPGGPKPDRLSEGVAGQMRTLMRMVVTQGTASELDLPGEPVHAKTGTAEFDSDDPSKTHGWMIGFRGGIAFGVLVENGESGSAAAGPVVRNFLQSL